MVGGPRRRERVVGVARACSVVGSGVVGVGVDEAEVGVLGDPPRVCLL